MKNCFKSCICFLNSNKHARVGVFMDVNTREMVAINYLLPGMLESESATDGNACLKIGRQF